MIPLSVFALLHRTTHETAPHSPLVRGRRRPSWEAGGHHRRVRARTRAVVSTGGQPTAGAVELGWWQQQATIVGHRLYDGIDGRGNQVRGFLIEPVTGIHGDDV
jgi:hypothetical protein